MTTKQKPIARWQTMQQAAAQSGYTRQRIHQMATIEKSVAYREIYGRSLVPDPFPIKKRKK